MQCRVNTETAPNLCYNRSKFVTILTPTRRNMPVGIGKYYIQQKNILKVYKKLDKKKDMTAGMAQNKHE